MTEVSSGEFGGQVVAKPTQEPEKLPAQPLRVLASDLSPADIQAIPEYLSREGINGKELTVRALVAIGGLMVAESSNYDVAMLGGVITAYSAIRVPVTLIESVKHLVTGNSPFYSLYPDIWKGLSNDRAGELLSDGVRGFYVRRTKDTPNAFYSAIRYKERVIKKMANRVSDRESSLGLVDLLNQTQDPELKMKIIEQINRRCKRYLLDDVKSRSEALNSTSEVESAMFAKLAVGWGVVGDPGDVERLSIVSEKLEVLDRKRLLLEASAISNEIISKWGDFPPTLVPYIRLFTVRRMMEEIAKNNLPVSSDTALVESIRDDALKRLTKGNLWQRENTYNPDAVTVGLEIQPNLYKSEFASGLRVNRKDVGDLSKYAGFKDSPDYPFEIVITPTRTAAAQLLILQEVMLLTGIPANRLGAQINFGGLTDEATVFALQRMMIAASRLDTDLESTKLHGDFWDLGSASKGEINIRDRFSRDVNPVNPDDKLHPEFSSVGEMRTDVEAETFMIFARGFVEMQRLAGFAKAYERVQAGASVTGVELEMAKKFTGISGRFNSMLVNHNLPNINAKWSRDNWRKFARTLWDDPDLRSKIRKFFWDTLH